MMKNIRPLRSALFWLRFWTTVVADEEDLLNFRTQIYCRSRHGHLDFEPRGYRGTREVGKKKEKRIPWGEALEPARAGRAALKFESGHGPERKIALSISLEKNRRNVNFDAAMTANEGCGYIMLRHRSSSLFINAWWKSALWKWNFQAYFMLCFQDFHDWTILREFLIQICWHWTEQQNILRQYELVMKVFWARITKRRSKRASFCWDIWKLLWC
jgi:hypothetical protein